MGADVLPKMMIVVLSVLGFSGVLDTFFIVLNIFRLFPRSLGRFFWVEFRIGLNGMFIEEPFVWVVVRKLLQCNTQM